MSDGLPAYREYKDSSQPWLGKVPAHWEIARAKLLYREVDERSKSGTETLCSVSHKTGVTPRKENVTMFMAESNVGYKICREDDLVINTLWAWMAALGVAQQIGVVSPAYGVYRPRAGSSLLPKYADRLLRTEQYKQEYIARSTGVNASRLRLYPEQFLQIPILLPPPTEQAAIVRFLGDVDRRIHRFVHAKRRLIGLLNELKQAIIHRAVTRGLDSNVRLKLSGAAWFPEVPSEWSVVPMRRVITRAVDGPHHSPAYVDYGVMFISARNVKVDEWCLTDAKYISQKDYEEFSRRIRPECGDVLYTKGGTTGIARAVDLDFPFQVWVHIAVLKVRRHIVTPQYLALALNSPPCYEQSQLYTRGATNQDLGLGRMKGIELPLPPTLAEQTNIVAYVDCATQAVRRAIGDAEREIALIREYRTRLIADVVTGKLDVRAAAAALPDEPEKLAPESLDVLAADDDNQAELSEEKLNEDLAETVNSGG